MVVRQVMKTLEIRPSPPVEPVPMPWPPADLPPFPAVALRALNVMSGTDTSLRELCELIRPDPVFSAEILRIANSPLVAFPKEITSVLQASMLLGFRRLKSVAITVGLRTYLSKSYTPALASCWRHSVACAMIAEKTAPWAWLEKDFAYTAGIMHDIGRIALATVLPESYARVLERASQEPCNFLEMEREVCGIDHCQAGLALVRAWKLPQDFIETTFHHHDPLTDARGPAHVIQLSCALAEALGFSAVRPGSPRNYEETLAGLPEAVRQFLPVDAQELASAITREIRVIELG
jgi:putative nucleotidyltransferase with HDIG domain